MKSFLPPSVASALLKTSSGWKEKENTRWVSWGWVFAVGMEWRTFVGDAVVLGDVHSTLGLCELGGGDNFHRLQKTKL